jgi:hypothetical protein
MLEPKELSTLIVENVEINENKCLMVREKRDSFYKIIFTRVS